MRYALGALGIAFGLLVDLAACRAQTGTDLPPGEKLVVLDGQLMSAHWSQDGKMIVTCAFRKRRDDADKGAIDFKTAALWNAATGKQVNSLGELELPTFPFHYLSADGTRLVISQGFFLSTGEIEVWNTKTAVLQHRISVQRRPRPMHGIAVSARGELIAEIFYDVPDFAPPEKKRSGGIHLYDAATAKKMQTLREEKSLPRTAVFTPDGQSILTRGSNDVIRLWNIKTGKVICEAQASLGSGGELALSPDGKKLLIPTMKHEALQLWSVPDLKPLHAIENPFETVMHVDFSPSGKRLLVAGFREPLRPGPGTAKCGVMVWDLEGNRMLHDWNTPAVRCGFCGEDHIGIGDQDTITRYRIGPAAKRASP